LESNSDTVVPALLESNSDTVAPALLESNSDTVVPALLESKKEAEMSLQSFGDVAKKGKCDASVDGGDVGDIGFYVVTHIPGRLVASMPELYTPICVGRAAEATTSNAIPHGALTNVLRHGDTLPHERWSELSSMYRVWKEGPRSRTVGFCHYRCFLNVTPSGHALHDRDARLSPDAFAKIAPDLQNKTLLRSVDDTHIIVKRPERIGTSVQKQYALCHVASDYATMTRLVAECCPEMRDVMVAQNTQTELYTRNVFVMSWRNFDSFCALAFDVLQRFCKGVEWPRASRYQSRDVSFLSERLFDAWLRSKQKTGCRITALPHIFVDFPAPTP
jgi:hypothetical protein